MKELTINELVPPKSPIVHTLRNGTMRDCFELFHTWFNEDEDEGPEGKFVQVLRGNWGPTRAVALYDVLYIVVRSLTLERPKILNMFDKQSWTLLRKGHQEFVRIKHKDEVAMEAEVNRVRGMAGLNPLPTTKCFECEQEEKVMYIRRDMCRKCISKFHIDLPEEEWIDDSFNEERDLEPAVDINKMFGLKGSGKGK